jgi:hypothetical protein
MSWVGGGGWGWTAVVDSNFNNLMGMGFTSKEMPYNILKNVYFKSFSKG